MKKSLLGIRWIPAVLALLFYGCVQERVETVPVDFDATEQDFEALVASIELMPLERDRTLRMGYAPSLYKEGDNWFLAQQDVMTDPDFRNWKVYRYDGEGHFRNAIGRKGDRLDEIFRIDNLQFRDGKLVVFSLEPAGGGEKAITFDYEGNVLNAQHFEFAGSASLLVEGGVLTYYGHGDRHGREGRLMFFSEEGLPRQSFLTERTAALKFQSNADVLCPVKDGVVVLDTYSDTLWLYKKGNLKPAVAFDTGSYAVDDDFFSLNMRECAARLFPGPYAMIHRYITSNAARMIEYSVQSADRKRYCLYGLDQGKGCRWFRAGAPFAGSIRLLEVRQAYCLLEPIELSEISDSLRARIANSGVLAEITPEDNYVIVRITFTEPN